VSCLAYPPELLALLPARTDPWLCGYKVGDHEVATGLVICRGDEPPAQTSQGRFVFDYALDYRHDLAYYGYARENSECDPGPDAWWGSALREDMPGCAQLALAMCATCLKDDKLALELHGLLAVKLVTRLPRTWKLRRSKLREAILNLRSLKGTP
jgi:hypothetical protein